jgi:hypothetical protein
MLRGRLVNHQQLTRRRFLVSIIALSAAAGSALRSDLFAVSRAWAESASSLEVSLREAMLRMARLLFPHDALSDDVYAEVLDMALSSTASSDEFAVHLDAAAAALDEKSGNSWQKLDEAAQLAAMRSIEAEPYFVAIREHVRLGIYNSPAFWEHVGYLGPSKGFGGYLHRGAGDIDWLAGDE